MSSGRLGRWCLAALAFVALSCDTPAPTRRPQGLSAGEEQPRGPVPPLPNPSAPSASTTTSTPSALPKSTLPSPFAPAAPNPGALSTTDGTAVNNEAVDAGVADAGPAEPPRDYPNELRAVLGNPTTCLDTQAAEAAGGKLTITAVANVSGTGRITRATVNAPNQPATALKCLESRLTTGMLRGPIANAPIVVTATVAIEIYQQPPAATPDASL